jgi:hypothetical protein
MDNRKRHLYLVAHFVNGYAKDWFMAVKECYRTELDIKYTERKKNKQSFGEWTQGPYFSFAEGHLFYDTPKGYEKWEKALTAVKTCCQISFATPTVLNKNKKLVEGMVFFTIYKPDETFTSLKAVKDYTLSQTEFVNFLKTGVLDK